MTSIERAVATLKGRQNKRYAPPKRSGKVKNFTISGEGDAILKAARVLWNMNMSEVVDAALKSWARSHRLDERLHEQTRTAMWGEGTPPPPQLGGE